MPQRSPTRTSSASAPGKVILFGEHFVVHGTGAVLVAITPRARAVAEPLEAPRISVETHYASETVARGGACSRLGPLVRAAEAALEANGDPNGMSVRLESEIPGGMGLGASSAACVAVAGAAFGLYGRPSAEKVARAALEAERSEFPAASGADHAACAHGGAVYFDGGARRLEVSDSLRPVVVPSSSRHRTARMVEVAGRFRKSDPARFEELCRTVSGIMERAEPMLASGDAGGLAALMLENHACLREIGVSTPELDRIVEQMGGGKMTGAGGGGCAVSVSDGPALPPGAMDVGMDRRGLEVF